MNDDRIMSAVYLNGVYDKDTKIYHVTEYVFNIAREHSKVKELRYNMISIGDIKISKIPVIKDGYINI
jgi:hypothetical protein